MSLIARARVVQYIGVEKIHLLLHSS